MDESISPQGKNTIRGICLAAGITGGIWLGLGLITFLFVIGEGIQSSQRNPNEPIDILYFNNNLIYSRIGRNSFSLLERRTGWFNFIFRDIYRRSPADNQSKIRFQHYFLHYSYPSFGFIYCFLVAYKGKYSNNSSR